MTEKVKITQVQADAVESFRKVFIENKATSMSNRKLIAVLNFGYEVELEYKVGDWIVRLDGTTFMNAKAVVQVDKVCDIHLFYAHDIGIDKIRVRHATPEEIKVEKERQKWAEIGRQVGEFRDGDMRISKENVPTKTTVPDFATGEYFSGELKGFFPAESFVSFEDGDAK